MIFKCVKNFNFLKFLIIVLFSCVLNNCAFIPTKKEVILEITTNLSDSSYPRGEVLDIKLYDNSEVEFDFYLPNTPERIGTKFISEKKQTELSGEGYEKIKFLLTESDLLNAKNYYEPSRQSSIDSFVKKTIIFKVNNQEKIIVLEERDSHLNLKEKSNIYPMSLIKLLEVVEDINKKLRQQIDPEST